MTYEFVQVTARKDNGDFALCSNLSLMDSRQLSPAEAIVALVEMAYEYEAEGFEVEWTREQMQQDEIEIWGGLFDQFKA